MKKLMIIFAMGAFIFTNETRAQGFFTSYGFEHQWGMPSEVFWSLDHHFTNYHLVHSRRFYDDGRLFFDVVLQRGDVFVNVNIGSGGYIFNQVYRSNYPFNSHVCNSFCGYHRDYYMSYRVVCNHHNHFGHNHVYYNPHVVYRRYGQGYHHGYNQGFAQGYHKAKKQGDYHNHQDHAKKDRENEYRRHNNSSGRNAVGLERSGRSQHQVKAPNRSAEVNRAAVSTTRTTTAVRPARSTAPVVKTTTATRSASTTTVSSRTQRSVTNDTGARRTTEAKGRSTSGQAVRTR